MQEIKIEVNEPIDLQTSLTSGQCFRWRIDALGRWVGVIDSGIIRISQDSNTLEIASSRHSATALHDLIVDYFRIGDDLRQVEKRISWDPKVLLGMQMYPGMRLLRQDPWEILVSFILSSTSNIPRISRTIELISSKYGEKISLEDSTRYTFPSAGTLAEVGEQRLRELGCGFRSPFLASAANAVATGKLPLYELRGADYFEALNYLTDLKGIGDKIADCVMLFSLDKMRAFPNDRWIAKALNEWYGFPLNAKYQDSRNWSWDRFGNDAGYANQYLFWNIRQTTRPLRSTATIENID